jgi:mono/diheme cytochrome c family protein
MMRELISGTTLILLLSLFGCASDDTMADAGETGDGGVVGDATHGEMLYTAKCVACHGADGKAGVVIGGVAAADLTFEITDLTDEELADVIKNGKGAAMPPQYTDEQDIADVIAYMHATFE